MDTKLSVKQPKELVVLSLCSTILRFGYWGIGNLLVLYMLQYYHASTTLAANIYGLFAAAGAILPLLCGYIADRWNYHWPLFIGTISVAIGCFIISIGHHATLYVGLLFACFGYGLFVPSVSAILSACYKGKEELRETGFSYFYAAFNIGVFAAMIILGYISQKWGWNMAFFVAGIVQSFGIIPAFYYYKKYHHLYVDFHPSVQQKAHAQAGTVQDPLKKYEKERIIVILALLVLNIFFMAAYTQGWSSMSVFVLENTKTTLFGFNIPSAWILSLETLFLLFLVVPIAKVYKFLQDRKIEPTPINKMVISLVTIGLSFVLMMVGVWLAQKAFDNRINPLFLALPYFVMAIAELLLAPITLSLTTRLSPKRYTAFLIGIVYLCWGVGYYLGGFLAGLLGYFSNQIYFYGLIALMTIIPALILLFFSKKLDKMRHMELE